MRGDGARWTIRGAGFTLGAGAVIVLATVVGAALHVVVLAFLGVLLAAALDPLVTTLRRRLRRSRGQAIVGVYVAFSLVVLLVGILVVPAAIGESQRIIAGIPTFLEGAAAWAGTIRPEVVGGTIASLVETLRAALDGAGRPPPADEVVEAGLTLAEVVMSVATLLVVVAFWLVERARLQRYLLAFAPAQQRPGGRARWNRVERRLGSWVRGQLFLMAVVGVASGIAYQLLGLPSALLLGLIAAICEAIPLVGPLLGAIPALLVAATIGPEAVVGVAVAYVVIHIVEGNFLVPVVMRGAMGLSPLLVLLSILVGAAVGGPVGALVAVPVAAMIEILLEPLQARDVPVATTESRPADDAADPRVTPAGQASL